MDHTGSDGASPLPSMICTLRNRISDMAFRAPSGAPARGAVSFFQRLSRAGSATVNRGRTRAARSIWRDFGQLARAGPSGTVDRSRALWKLANRSGHLAT